MRTNTATTTITILLTFVVVRENSFRRKETPKPTATISTRSNTVKMREQYGIPERIFIIIVSERESPNQPTTQTTKETIDEREISKDMK